MSHNLRPLQNVVLLIHAYVKEHFTLYFLNSLKLLRHAFLCNVLTVVIFNVLYFESRKVGKNQHGGPSASNKRVN